MPQRNVVVIGTSAGGLEALKQVFAGLSATTSATFFVVQHIARHRPQQLDSILNNAVPLPVSVGKHEEPFQPGHVYVAPPDRHMLLSDGNIILSRGPRENRARPAIDPLFRSAAVAYGPRVIGVVLTGMLDDGTAGLLAVKRCGGTTVVQDPADALYGEMPQSAIDYVEVDYVERLINLPTLLTRLINQESGHAVAIPRDLVLEARMAEAERSDTRHTEVIGQLTGYACPECNGPLWQVNDAAFERYRCHTGHVFTARAMADEWANATERALWVAVRTMEERARMLRRLARQEEQRDRFQSQKIFGEEAAELEDHLGILRQLLSHQSPAG